MTTVQIRLFRPSNASQGDAFIAGWCGECARQDFDGGVHCEIALRTMAFDISDSEYPTEWQYDKDGDPCCTAFIPEGEPIPEPACKHTHDLFGA